MFDSLIELIVLQNLEFDAEHQRIFDRYTTAEGTETEDIYRWQHGKPALQSREETYTQGPDKGKTRFFLARNGQLKEVPKLVP